MRNRFWDLSTYFASGYVMHIVATEKMSVLNALCIASTVMMIGLEVYYSYRKRESEKA